MSLAEDLRESWMDPPSLYRGAPFWSWNERLVPDRLRRQIEAMADAGMGGFFMHSRYGLKTPYLSDEWFACIGACVEKARELGLKAYLYDEDRWPSGPAGGFVTRAHPEFRVHCLCSGDPTGQGDLVKRLGSFRVELDGAGGLVSYEPCGDGEGLAFSVCTPYPTGWENDGGYLDTMDSEAVDEYIRVTHEAYAARYADEFGETIPAIFTDEPNYGFWSAGSAGEGARVQWTRQMEAEFAARRGYEITAHLPELVYPLSGGRFSRVRYDYHRTLTELFVEHFSAKIGRWCAEHGIALTGHYLLEGALDVQTRAVGACMPHYEHMQWPGIDILTDQADELLTAKQCSSVADQLGLQRVLSELYGCTGWDWPLEGHKFVGDWQYAVGVNFRCQHLSHYSLAGGAKRDYPASILYHSPWWPYYRVVEDYFGRLSLMLTQGRPVRDVLVVHPVESAWGLYCSSAREPSPVMAEIESGLRAVMFTLTGQHYDWDFADESLLARHGQVVDGVVRVGQMSYSLVVVPPCVTLRASTVEVLRGFLREGGKVLFVGRQPERIDAEASDLLRDLVGQATVCDGAPEALVRAVESLLPRRVSVTVGGAEQADIWAMLREVEGGRLLFVQSHNRKAGRRVELRVEGGGPVVLWDAVTGERTRVPATVLDGHAAFSLDLDPSGSALVSLGMDVAEAKDPPGRMSLIARREVRGPFDVVLTEPNTLPLDMCRFRVADGEWSETVPTLKADQQIRARYGLGTRLGNEHQPWYLYAMGTVDTAPREPCQLEYRFHASEVPSRCGLAIERPEDYEIRVNGTVVSEVEGHFVDDDIRTIDIAAALREGDNQVLLSFVYRPDMELEDLYLVGRFGVATVDGSRPRPGGVTLVAPPTQLALGSWVGQGLDFYGGSVRYRLQVGSVIEGQRLRVSLPGVECTAVVFHVNGEEFVRPWAPFAADITDALSSGSNDVTIEVIGGRKNILGPLHSPWEQGTGPDSFSPDHPRWTDEYQLTDHGLMSPVVLELLEG